MLYDANYDRLERARWDLNTDIPWKDIKKNLITHEDLWFIKANSLIEYTSLDATEAFIRDFSHDMDFCSFVSIWYYEEMKHHYVLKRYVQEFGIDITEEECAKMRASVPPADKMNIITVHFIGEFRLALWYNTVARAFKEPVLKKIYKLIADDEIRHGTCYLGYLKNFLERDPKAIATVLKTSLFMLRSQVHPTVLTGTIKGLEGAHKVYDKLKTLVREEDIKATYNKLFAHLSTLSGAKLQSLKDVLAHLQELRRQGIIPPKLAPQAMAL